VALLCNRLVIQRQRGEPRVTKIEYIDGADDAAIAAWVAERLKAALRRSSGPVAISVPGGATPFPICAELVRHPIDWSRITIWPGDDRIVPEDHPASNVGRIRALFTLTGARVVALEEGGIPPRFALTWLGMGTDGHIASLFPNTNPRLDDPCQIRRVTPDPLPLEAPFARLTLTLPALLNSEALMFVIRGEGKHRLFEAAARAENDLPVARLLCAASQPVICFR
jgi:6-phosphogluconolactonase